MTTKEKILSVSLKLFNEQGTDVVTVRHIAQAVGMHSGSPFYHFKSKGELLTAVMHDQIRRSLRPRDGGADGGGAPEHAGQPDAGAPGNRGNAQASSRARAGRWLLLRRPQKFSGLFNNKNSNNFISSIE